ncbi:T9SS type A sorting domain-containing protein [bacterium]|nr:T9SS type A sorting domain-containing protein [bacterium]
MQWNAGDLPSGTYFYRIETDGQCLTRKLVLLK